MTDYRDQAAAAIRATVFNSAVTFSWFGKMLPSLHPSVRRSLTRKNQRDYLLACLQSRLYGSFYCPGYALPERPETAGTRSGALPLFLEELSAANAGRGCWEEGWIADAYADGKVLVRNHGLKLWAPADETAPLRPGPVAEGSPLRVRFPKDAPNLTPGFYMALGDRDLPAGEAQVRLYWNLTPRGAVRLMESVTSDLNREALPYRFKVFEGVGRSTRRDTGVLYLARSSYPALRPFLSAWCRRIATDLMPGVPSFTKPLAEGLGLAEDPGNGDSFGLHRSALLAEALIRAHEARRKSLPERLQTVERCFEEQFLSLDRPYLSAGSAGDYEGPQPGPAPIAQAPSPAAPAAPTSEWLETARTIALRLCSDALWHEDRCNWLGFAPVVGPAGRASGSRELAALGPDLYSGTSGVALFLAQAHAATGEAILRRTAVGALLQALSALDQVPEAGRPGLFTGWSGIAYAGVRVSILLDHEELFRKSRGILERLRRNLRTAREFDLMSGSSGAILGILALRNRIRDDSILDLAVRLGDGLLRRAQRGPSGWSWNSTLVPNRRPLTGLSHGASGAGAALLELGEACGEAAYRRAAEKAFEYERSWFDPQEENWPDLREEAGFMKRSRPPYAFTCTWCHGAPGIALSRLRAVERWGDPVCRAEARAALRTTLRSLQRPEDLGSANYSLCHGFGGNSEPLLCGRGLLGEESAGALAAVRAVAAAGARTHGVEGREWPCGSGVGETPGLMLGLAGIGYFYLRLHSFEVPSVLLPRPEDLSS